MPKLHLLMLLPTLLILSNCAGTPQVVQNQTAEEYADSFLAPKSLAGVCKYYDLEVPIERCFRRHPEWTHLCPRVVEGLKLELRRRGLADDYCANRTYYDEKLAFEKKWNVDTFNIDTLRVTQKERRANNQCNKGSEIILELEGAISPDSSFAMDRLLSRATPCKDQQANVLIPITVVMNSTGGFLQDGYKLGRTLRESGAKVVIDDSSVCASSCAVAFLGGVNRVVSETGKIMFHAPYFSGKNEYGVRDIDCDVGEEALAELNDYYISMTDKETGDRLFERTMWYCSADDGWVVTGGAAAELYGIATER